jgi:ribose 1,5-bisphosphokinase
VALASSEFPTTVSVGAFVGIVGPSGAGKDSVMAHARALLHDELSIVFAQRIVTRTPDVTERNVAMSEGEIARIASQGGFALAWTAHDLSYAIPVALDADVTEGRVVVANVSRAVVPELRRRYRRGRVVLIDAPRDLRRARLAQRGREDAQAVDERLAREVSSFLPADADLVIDNSGRLEDAAQALASYLSGLLTAPVQTAGA